ncbi:MAG: Acetyltransferase domain [Candidatus Parcubacteria bacterium]|jgi:GNAT superfamily N-acetyltransferase|nr:Acetyltransferase domain [Candidatus Parcubacteria bacterium]
MRTEIDELPWQQQHDIYVSRARRARLKPEDQPRYDLAMWRERNGHVKPLATVRIRNVTGLDIAHLAGVYVAVYEDFDVGERWTHESAQALIRYSFERQPDLAFVASVPDAAGIVGGSFAGIKPWWDGNHLVDGELFVHPDYQRLGIGSTLLAHMFSQAMTRHNAVVVEGCTFRKSGHPLTWYKSLGFGEVKEWTMIRGDLLTAYRRLRGVAQ